MLREIVETALSAQPDMEVVGDLERPRSLLAVVDETAADFVIAGIGSNRSGELKRFVQQRPHVKVLAVAADGRHGLLYEVRPQTEPLGELSPAILVRTIRARADASREVLMREEL
jgi:DNA-binding NarL/FixJ family response regulator